MLQVMAALQQMGFGQPLQSCDVVGTLEILHALIRAYDRESVAILHTSTCLTFFPLYTLQLNTLWVLLQMMTAQQHHQHQQQQQMGVGYYLPPGHMVGIFAILHTLTSLPSVWMHCGC